MTDEWRLYVRLRSLKALREFMAFHGIRSGYALAQKAGILPGTVNHLLSGRRTACSLAAARAIEEALGCPVGFLLEARMSHIEGDKERRSAA